MKKKYIINIVGLLIWSIAVIAIPTYEKKDLYAGFKKIKKEHNSTTLREELKKIDNLIQKNENNFDKNFFKNYYNKSYSFKKKDLMLNELKLLSKNKDYLQLVAKINNQKTTIINDYRNMESLIKLLDSFNKYKGIDEKAYYVQLQHILNNFKEKRNIERKSIIKKVDNKTIKLAYLSFDDGPSKNSKKLVNLLNNNNIKGTFFVVGSEVAKKKNKENLKFILDNNHVVGIHGYSHVYDKTRDKKKFEKEIEKTNNMFKNDYNYSTFLLRSPYGSFTLKKKDIKYYLEKKNQYLWDWNVDTLDWKYKKKPSKVEKISKNQIKSLKNKDITVLYHEYDSSIESLEDVINLLKKEGYHFANMHPEYFYSNYFDKKIN